MKRAIIWTLLGLAFIFVFMPAFVGGVSNWTLFAHLAFGWIKFLQRNLVQLTWNWNLIAMGTLCSAGFMAVAFLFLKTAVAKKQLQTSRDRFGRYSFALYGAVWLLF